ncbi:hypothetical protein IQ269_14255 [Tychonema sp. LEGE 07199]|uniref:hypothetical protein n=1 Tax=unclassified Tychonema TaxID=2642144 RepID=UPI00187EDDDD|nr:MULTISPECIES: hypothetical protein [unclassified Tychonema]MBE9121934.1 hypothetical protein [Tychonema sp. LEGE 07199]MBE9133822.1 hypothetical protein [Tychonema sp. LEGE 07196]
MNLSKITIDTRALVNGFLPLQPSIDGGNTRASPDYSLIVDIEIILGDRPTASHTIPIFPKNITKMST